MAETMSTECDICSRVFSGRRQPLCLSCAQVALYDPRIRQASSLLDCEKAHTQSEAVIRPGNDGIISALPQDTDFDAITHSIGKHSYERTEAQQQATIHRIHQIVNKAEELRAEIEAYKAKVVAQKQDHERRRKELAVEQTELEKHKPRASEPVLSATKKTSQRLEKVRGRIVDARHLLCQEAASASNLRRRKGANGRSEYSLGGIIVPDLRELNVKTQAPSKNHGGRTVAEPHDLVSEALDNVARLLNLSSHYLSVRVPAEMILPHEEFPRSVVMPEKSSYKFKNVPFPGIAIGQSASPAASRVLEQNIPRPRPLWLDRPLAQLSQTDPKSYGLFIEGVTLLAWNVASLCKTQGIDTINTFDDVCAIGRNLWQLLMMQQRKSHHKPSLDRKLSGKDEQPKDKTVRLGIFSHASAEHNLASYEGLDLLRGWKLAASGHRLADKLKSHLFAEISGAEWDMLSEREWDEEREDEKPVLVGGSRRPQESKHAAMSIMTVAPHDGTEEEKASASEGKRTGNSGWMKVRGRNGDA